MNSKSRSPSILVSDSNFELLTAHRVFSTSVSHHWLKTNRHIPELTFPCSSALTLCSPVCLLELLLILQSLWGYLQLRSSLPPLSGWALSPMLATVPMWVSLPIPQPCFPCLSSFPLAFQRAFPLPPTTQFLTILELTLALFASFFSPLLHNSTTSTQTPYQFLRPCLGGSLCSDQHVSLLMAHEHPPKMTVEDSPHSLMFAVFVFCLALDSFIHSFTW